MRLRRLVRQHLNAEVTLVTSTTAAIAVMGEQAPDVVLTSSLVGPRDEKRLAAHLRQAPSLRHLPILTIPPIVDERDTSGARQRGLLWRLLGRRTRDWPTCDLEAVASRIREAVEQAKAASADRPEEAVGDGPTRLADADAGPELVEAPASVLQMTDSELRSYCGLGSRQNRAHRFTTAELPWISSVRLGWGLELRLLNLSRSGMLVESGIRLTPGARTSIHLRGPDKDMVVGARVVRSRVSAVDSLGVKYVAAAEFEQGFDAWTPAEPAPEVLGGPSEYFMRVVAGVRDRAARGDHPVDLRTAFETGVRDLVAAREIRLREAPVVENDECESVYFTIPTHDAEPAVLQVTFEPNYRPNPKEFEALKAAALAAADVLQFTPPARQVSLATTFLPAPADLLTPADTNRPHHHASQRSTDPTSNVVPITSARVLRPTG